MAGKYLSLLWIISIEITIVWWTDLVVMGHSHHRRLSVEDLNGRLTSNLQSRLMRKSTTMKENLIMVYEGKRGPSHVRIPSRLNNDQYSRHRRYLNHNNDLPEVALSLMSFHQVGSHHLRVLYVYGDVVAGKAIKTVATGRRLNRIGFRVIKLRNGNHAMKVVGNSSNGIHRFVVADRENDGLRVCQGRNAAACEVVRNGLTIRSPIFKIRHFKRRVRVLFPYQWGLAFQFGDSAKYLKISSTTGETILSDCETEITKFNIFFNGG